MVMWVRTDHKTEFSDSSGPGFEGRYPGRFWYGTAGKCMLDFVVAGFRIMHEGF